MAWVTLAGLTTRDVNYFGYIPGTVRGRFFLTEIAKKLLKKRELNKISKLDGQEVEIAEFIEKYPDLAAPEWTLNAQGCLVNWAMLQIDGKIGTHELWGIDITEHLKSLPDKQLQQLADVCFWTWGKGANAQRVRRTEKHAAFMTLLGKPHLVTGEQEYTQKEIKSLDYYSRSPFSPKR